MGIDKESGKHWQRKWKTIFCSSTDLHPRQKTLAGSRILYACLPITQWPVNKATVIEMTLRSSRSKRPYYSANNSLKTNTFFCRLPFLLFIVMRWLNTAIIGVSCNISSWLPITQCPIRKATVIEITLRSSPSKRSYYAANNSLNKNHVFCRIPLLLFIVMLSLSTATIRSMVSA